MWMRTGIKQSKRSQSTESQAFKMSEESKKEVGNKGTEGLSDWVRKEVGGG